jgi:hypothetical protein
MFLKKNLSYFFHYEQKNVYFLIKFFVTLNFYLKKNYKLKKTRF